jgi:predicted DCC family thiol-disulfide oxidoreductase YuxK
MMKKRKVKQDVGESKSPLNVKSMQMNALLFKKSTVCMLLVCVALLYGLMREVEVERRMETWVPPKNMALEGRVVLFDGVCVLCNSFVNFLLDNDFAHSDLKFAPLQSDVGIALLGQHNLPLDIESIVLIERGQAFVRSSAALRIFKRMPTPWPSVYYVFALLPEPLRDIGYMLVAYNRYRMFGVMSAPGAPDDDAPDEEEIVPSGECRVYTDAEELRFLNRLEAVNLQCECFDDNFHGDNDFLFS